MSARPRSDEIDEIVAQTDQLRAQQEPLRREIKGLEEVASQDAELTTALRLLEQLIPSGLTQPALPLQPQEATRGAGVKLESIAFGDPEIPEGAPESTVAGTVPVAMPLTVVVEDPRQRHRPPAPCGGRPGPRRTDRFAGVHRGRGRLPAANRDVAGPGLCVAPSGRPTPRGFQPATARLAPAAEKP